MKRHTVRSHIAIAGLLTLLLVALAAVPATAATPRRMDWHEGFAHKLVNCMRTGGRITTNGKCDAYGSGKYSYYVAPLKRSNKISNKVSWPWARRSAQFYGTRSCWIGHSRSGSTVDSRFRQASLRNSLNGENMGCGLLSTPRKTTLTILRMWQKEKTWRGSHWRQIKSKKFNSAGYGVAKYGARKTQILVNFYGPSVN